MSLVATFAIVGCGNNEGDVSDAENKPQGDFVRAEDSGARGGGMSREEMRNNSGNRGGGAVGEGGFEGAGGR
ncbi:MAG: hypothetical protein R2688_00015 [Fimbriimonadaceae bacterium]